MMPSDDCLFLENQLCFALYSSSLTMIKAYRPLLKALGVTYPQYLVLLVLWQTDKVSVSALGQKLYLDSGTLTPLLKRLEQAGLIHRERSSEDERQVLVSLTPAGKNLKKKAVEIPKQLLCAAQYSEAQARSLTKTLRALQANLMRYPLTF